MDAREAAILDKFFGEGTADRLAVAKPFALRDTLIQLACNKSFDVPIANTVEALLLQAEILKLETDRIAPLIEEVGFPVVAEVLAVLMRGNAISSSGVIPTALSTRDVELTCRARFSWKG